MEEFHFHCLSYKSRAVLEKEVRNFTAFVERIVSFETEYWAREIILKTERSGLLDFAKFQLSVAERF